MRAIAIAFLVSAVSATSFEKKILRHEGNKKDISSNFEGLGYSPVCVAKALASCELSIKPNTSSEAEDLGKHQYAEVSWRKPRDCQELLVGGDSITGVRTVYPYDCCKDRKVIVYCDQTTDEGGWTVIQNRDNLTIREDFYRTWIEYTMGFGNVSGEFWLGLNNIHALVSSTLMELRIDMEDYDGVKRWAKYGIFYVNDESTKFTLRVGRYSGDAGDGLTPHNGMKFSTYDQDNDLSPSANVAATYKGAHWYTNSLHSNFNGYQYSAAHASDADGVEWYYFRGNNYSLRKINLKVRPAFR